MLLPTIIPLIIPNNVLHEIKYLCKNIPKVEWSGILFYTLQGSITKPKSLKIILKTILPLDMGTAAFTSYNLDERFINFLEEDFDVRSQWKVGHIHSHNVMRVFFSGTDMEELHDNAPGHDFYVSLIVNNFMDFTAKVAFTGTAKQSIKNVPFIALDEKGKPYTIKTSDYKVDDTKLFIYDCEVKSSVEKIKVIDSFVAQTVEIMKPKPLPSYQQPKTLVKYNEPKKEEAKNPFDYPWFRKDKIKTPNDKEIKQWNNSFEKSRLEFDEEIDEEEDADEAILYLFIKKLFNLNPLLSEVELDDLALEEVIDTLLLADLSPFQIASTVIEQYTIVFKAMFPNASAEDFIIITYDVLEALECDLEQYPELKLSIKLINSMVEKFIENERSTSKV